MSVFFKKCALPLSIVLASIAIFLLVWWGVCIWRDINLHPAIWKPYWDWISENGTFAIGIITALLLISAGLLAGSQLLEMRRSRYAELMVHLEEKWDSAQFIEMRHRIDMERHKIELQLHKEDLSDSELKKKVVRKFGEVIKESDEYARKDFFTLTSILDHFETLAYLINKDYIPMEDVRETFGAAMVNYFGLFEYYIKEIARKQPGNHKAYEQLEAVTIKLRPTFMGES